MLSMRYCGCERCSQRVDMDVKDVVNELMCI